MFLHHLFQLKCSFCNSSNLDVERLPNDQAKSNNEIWSGFIWCRHCLEWYPIERGVLDFLTGPLEYPEILNDFWNKNNQHMKTMGLNPRKSFHSSEDFHQQKIQQNHSDWFADNDEKNYTEFANTPFWHSVDHIVFASWKNDIPYQGAVLEPGCGQGRFTQYLFNRPLRILAFDLSRNLLYEASETYMALRASGRVRAEVSFMAADATSIPLTDNAFDAVFLYGVLHHLPKPDNTCKEISRVLTPEGFYFGMENNYTVLRGIFNLLQKLFPLWKEVAGPEAQISHETLKSWLSQAGMNLHSYTHVFVPPHIVNMFSHATARKILDVFDAFGMRLPYVKDHGGLITFVSKKNEHS